jgi:hypothetical protein
MPPLMGHSLPQRTQSRRLGSASSSVLAWQ